MKKLFILFLFLFLGVIACGLVIDEVWEPKLCYATELQVSSSSGEIIYETLSWDYIDTYESLSKWKSDEGITVIKDTEKGTYTIISVVCVDPDIKEK